MKGLMENLYLLVAAVALIGIVVGAVYRFLGQPSEKQKEKLSLIHI